MKILLRTSLMACVCLTTYILLSCSSSEQRQKQIDNDHSQARNLYMELRNMTNRYIDSLKNLSDTVDINDFENRYEKSIHDIYYRYPGDLDVEMTQGEQDTLWILTDRFIRLKMRKFGRTLHSPDSLMADTVA